MTSCLLKKIHFIRILRSGQFGELNTQSTPHSPQLAGGVFNYDIIQKDFLIDHRMTPLGYSERIRELERLITQLIESNHEVPVIVEGEEDVKCLRKLGLRGLILKVHTGKTLHEFCTDLSEQYNRVILLMDWDRKGQQIHERLARDLDSNWMRYDPIRQGLKFLCHPDIQEVEQLDRHLQGLKDLQEGIYKGNG